MTAELRERILRERDLRLRALREAEDAYYRGLYGEERAAS
jgi:hypothetical protein